jgi:phage tail-like protein
VVGLVDPPGLLVFDLHAGGPPLQYRWPSGVPFVPFDLAAAPGGGVWILDRVNRVYWGLDGQFRVFQPSAGGSTKAQPEDFQPVGSPIVYRSSCDALEAISIAQAMPIAAVSPIGIEALPDGSVLILDSQPALGYSRIYRYQLTTLSAPPVALDQLDIGDAQPYPLLGQDLAVGNESLYVADARGPQTFAFQYDTDSTAWAREPATQFLPMLRFGGRALVTGQTGLSYDFDERWASLVEQPRSRFETQAVLMLPQRDALLESDPQRRAFDGKQPGCVWHRLFLDASIPPGTQVNVETRAADSVDALISSDWNAEPRPYLRPDSAELPYYRPALNCPDNRTGTWELLFQAARGRYLQIQLTLTGDGRRTPRIQALRAYYPRFSYLTHYLPAVYRNNASSAHFLDRYLANPEGFFTVLEDRMQQAQELFDPRTAPSDYLAWLAGWMGISFDFTWSETVQRFFLANARRFFQSRGTRDGIVRMIRLALDQCANASLFSPADLQHFSVRIVENYELQSASPAALGDPGGMQAPGAVSRESNWTATQGAAALLQQFRSYLNGVYTNIAALNDVWGSNFASFNDPALQLPAIQPSQANRASDWRQFLDQALIFTYATVTSADEPAFEDFLKRRYAQAADLNKAYSLTGTSALSSFGDILSRLWNGQLANALPESVTFLEDWILFVSVVLPARQNAHRFSVVIPVNVSDDVATQQARRNVAQRVTNHEKPAHTDFDVKLYWAVFSAGQSRLGLESVVGPSSRFTAVLLGQSPLAASYLGYVEPWNIRSRPVAGGDQLRQQTGIRSGGPCK